MNDEERPLYRHDENVAREAVHRLVNHAWFGHGRELTTLVSAARSRDIEYIDRAIAELDKARPVTLTRECCFTIPVDFERDADMILIDVIRERELMRAALEAAEGKLVTEVFATENAASSTLALVRKALGR